jgi:hypothetical protein
VGRTVDMYERTGVNYLRQIRYTDEPQLENITRSLKCVCNLNVRSLYHVELLLQVRLNNRFQTVLLNPPTSDPGPLKIEAVWQSLCRDGP